MKLNGAICTRTVDEFLHRLVHVHLAHQRILVRDHAYMEVRRASADVGVRSGVNMVCKGAGPHPNSCTYDKGMLTVLLARRDQRLETLADIRRHLSQQLFSLAD